MLVEDDNKVNIDILSKFSHYPVENILYTNGRLLNYLPNFFDMVVNHICERYFKNHKIQIFFNHQSEAFHQPFLENICLIIDAVMKRCNIRFSQFHLVTGAVKCERSINAYKTICKKYNYHQIALWFDNYWEVYSNKQLPNFNITFERKEKRILCYNGIPRMHRVAALCEIIKRNIFDKCYVSMKLEKQDIHKFHFKGINNLLQADVADEYSQIINKNSHLFPLKLTLQDDIKNAYNLSNHDRKLYKNTVVSLVNETVFSGRDPMEHRLDDILTYPCTFLTEKFNKTFQGLHPFIVMTTPYFLSDLRELGYKTFHPYIDETYDTIEDDNLRFNKVMDEVERFAKMRDSLVFRFQHDTKDILLHNYNLLKTKSRTVTRAL